MQVDERHLNRLGVELVLLFGSRARGDSRSGSDFDLGVLFLPRRTCELNELEEVREALGGGDQLDLVCLNTADPLLLRLAAEEGIAHYEAYPGAVEEFRVKAHKRYMDTAKFRRLESEALRSLHG